MKRANLTRALSKCRSEWSGGETIDLNGRKFYRPIQDILFEGEIVEGVELVSLVSEEVDEMLQPYRDSNKTLLDYGCGFGFIANAQRAHFDVTGFDTPEFTDCGRDLYGSIISSEPLTHSYDVVVSIGDPFDLIESYCHDLVILPLDSNVPDGWSLVSEGESVILIQKDQKSVDTEPDTSYSWS